MFLVDTNVFSETTRKRPNGHVKAWLERTPVEDVILSVVVIGEVRRGIEKLKVRGDVANRRLETWLAAQARVRNLQVVTRNVKHFVHRDVRILNPFDVAP